MSDSTRGSAQGDEALGGSGASTAGARDTDKFDGWWEDRSLPQKIMLGIGFGVLGIGLLALFGWFVMLLWNWLMPDLFGLKPLSYWKAWGLLALSTILFKSIGGRGGGGSSDRKRRKHLRQYLREEAGRARTTDA